MKQINRILLTFRTVWEVTLLFVLLPSGLIYPQERPDPERVTVNGLILDEATRTPLEGVRVYFMELNLTIHTDAAGGFVVPDIQKGVYRLELTHPEYRPSEGQFTVDKGGLFVTVLTPLNGDPANLPGRFVGHVTDGNSGESVRGVAVKLAHISMLTVTNNSGRFALPSVPPGRYAVEFSSLGYATRVDSVDIVSGQTSDVRVRLALTPIELEPIEVIVEPRELVLEDVGFYQRRTAGFGKFIDRTRIEERGPYNLTDLFTGIAGVSLINVTPMDPAVVLRAGRMGRRLCFPRVVLDGLVVHDSGGEPAMIDRLVGPEVVAGIEIYPSSAGVPIQYEGRGDTCGTILIWTRR